MNIIKPTIFTLFESDDKFQQFVQDIISEFVMDKKKPLVLKYEEIQNYSQVLETHKFLQDLGNVIIDNTINSAKNLKKLILKCDLGITEQRVNILAEILYYNIQSIQKQSIQRQIALNQLVLVDFNWNINVSIAADNLSRTQIPLLVLQLILKRYGSEKEQRVNLEFSKEELEAFLKKLNKLKSDIFNLDIQQ
ncbi:hypothetical protein ABPG72_016921 [Tetrahymena utriculariae]